MKKYLLTMVALLCLGFTMNAQVSVSADFLVSTKSKVKPDLGVSLMYLHDIDGALNIGGLVGYRQYLTKEFNANIPFMAIARYYVTGSSYGFYPQLGLGGKYYFWRKTFTILGNTNVIKGSMTQFAYSLGGGYKVSETLDLGLHFEGSGNNVNGILFRVGFGF
ncbi:MAG: hypothetical protein GX140_08015 [Bacteroidales bacterium]|jgi:hypothetical protein|nr:hypothetical protein [Bacteroidales bacterium]